MKEETPTQIKSEGGSQDSCIINQQNQRRSLKANMNYFASYTCIRSIVSKKEVNNILTTNEEMRKKARKTERTCHRSITNNIKELWKEWTRLKL